MQLGLHGLDMEDWMWWVIRRLSNRLPRFTAVVNHIGGRDDFFLSLPFFLRHVFNQCVSRFYGSIVKGAA